MKGPIRTCFYTIICYSFLFLIFWFAWNIKDSVHLQLPKYSILKLKKNTLSSKSPQSLHKYICRIQKGKDVSCEQIFAGNIKYISRVKYMTSRFVPDECDIYRLVQNCSKLRAYHEYASKPNSQEEKEYPLAFSIKLHKSVKQAEQLLRTIYMPQHFYCIHVDKKAEKSVHGFFQSFMQCFDNIFVVADNEDVNYGLDSLLKVELKCMKILLNVKGKWKYYINLTGQEFPLYTNREIVSILKLFNGANDLESYPFPKNNEYRYNRSYELHPNKSGRAYWQKPFKYKIEFRKGSAYGMFSRSFVEFLLEDEIATAFIKWAIGTRSPEEMVWSTLNALPWAPGGYQLYTRHSDHTHASKAVLWLWDKTKCQGKMVHSICLYGIGDLKVLAMRPELFANKFDHSIDAIPTDCIEETLKQRTTNPNLSKLNWNYYKLLPHVRLYQSLNQSEITKEALDKKKRLWFKEYNISYPENDNL